MAHALVAGGGVTLTSSLIRALVAASPGFDFLILVPDLPAYRLAFTDSSHRVEYVRPRPIVARAWFELRALPAILDGFRPDLVFALGNMPFLHRGTKAAVLIQNAYLCPPFPWTFAIPWRERIRNGLQRLLLRHRLPRTDLAFVQTRSMADRLRRSFASGPREVTILPNALPLELAADLGAVPAAPPRRRAGSLRLLVMTRYYPHKNLEAIVACFKKHRADLAGVTVEMMVASNQHPWARRLMDDITSSGLNHVIHCTGPVPASELRQAYERSDAVLLPTLLESFSATYLETMATCRPIITSDAAFAREICGPAAVYIDPRSGSAMRDAIIALRDDIDEAERIARLGPIRLAQVTDSWAALAESAVQSLSRVLAGANADVRH